MLRSAAIAAVLVALAAAFWPGSAEPLESLLARFARASRPAFELNLSELYGKGGQFAVLNPLLDVRPFASLHAAGACGSIGPDGEPTCKNADAFSLTLPDEKKGTILSALNEGRAIPEDFALHPPFVDTRGNSYAALLVRQGAAPFADRAWVATHLAYFTARELGAILSEFAIDDPRFRAISALGETGVQALVHGDSALLTPDFLYLRDQSRLAFSPLLYRAYPASDLRAFLEGGDRELVPAAAGAYCLERSGSLCLTYSSRTALARLVRYSFAIGLAFALVALAAAAFAWRAYLVRRHEEERRRLSLQILSHEFRTPVASVLLLAERLARNAQAMPEQEQDLVTAISAEAHRLQRILETSRNYLSAAGPRITPVAIPALNEWLREVAEETDARIVCDLLPADEAVTADTFWLRLALVNLLRNAFAHGAEPVTLRARKHRGGIRISVVDRGHCEFGSLAAMAEPFAKRAASPGLGLGLNITDYVVRQWGGRLDFEPAPTSFSFTLGEGSRWPGF